MLTRVVAVGIGLVLLAGSVQARADTSPTLEVGPALPGSAAQVTGSGWDPDPELGCTLTTDVPSAVIGDGGCSVSAEGVIGETVLIPAETEPGDYVLRVCQPACNQVNGIGAELERTLEVQEPPPTTEDATSTPPDGNGGSTDGGQAEDVTPTSGDLSDLALWAVLAVLLLAALATAVRFRRRRVVAPATAVAALRPTAPPVVRVDGADRPPRWTIGLAPRPDPGTTTVEEADR
ncbi:MAG: hypothetical protein M3353_04030 [Actinomycetota bacterium]|nr:hypothetical protein [Actinomycetota bacterium]